jgi:predicted ATP-binding protein involved in virulence
MENRVTTQEFHSGKRLQKLRELEGLDILEVAEKFNISFIQLEKWEADGIPAESVQVCCDYFEVPNSIFTEPVSSDYELEKLIESYLFSKTSANSTVDKITQPLSLDLPDGNLEINWLSGQSQFPCVKYERLRLINIGIYEDLEINFNHDLTVLIGLNGAGKTTILKAIALATLGSEFANDETDTIVDLLRITGKSHNQAVWQAKGSIELSASVNGEVYENRIELSYNSNTEKVDIKGERFDALFDEKGHLLNLTLGIGEQRIVSLKKPHNLGFEVTQSKVKDLLPLISNEVQACIAHFASWLANLALQAKDGNEDSQTVIKTSFDIFSALMQENIQFSDLTSIDPLELWIEQQDFKQTLPLHLYSQGYQAVMGWVGYIVQRVFEAYSDLPNPLLQPAIIIIDEIDQLLHVKWQQNILGVLTEFFPRTQWIITTHSPMVVTGLDQGKVVQLHQNEEGKFIAEKNAVDLWLWQYGDVVRYLFEASPKNLATEQQEQRLKEKISDLKRFSALTFEQQQELSRLEMQLERVQKSRAFVDELYAQQQKLQAKEQELAALITSLSQQASH